MKSLSRVRLFVTLWTVARQVPPSIGFSRQAYWSGLPFPPPGDLPDQGIEPRSPALQADTLPSKPPVWQCRKHIRDAGSIPGCGRCPWRRPWQPTPVFLPGASSGLQKKFLQTRQRPWLHDTAKAIRRETDKPALASRLGLASAPRGREDSPTTTLPPTTVPPQVCRRRTHIHRGVCRAASGPMKWAGRRDSRGNLKLKKIPQTHLLQAPSRLTWRKRGVSDGKDMLG